MMFSLLLAYAYDTISQSVSQSVMYFMLQKSKRRSHY